ncbi:MAG: hypothetical protein EBR82_46365 [Caulobacteraceae bacterium]|nr:hypothetical protein [Caulobacteraceae bacterium]
MTDLTILDAIADRLASVNPPAGYTLRKVYATPPEGLPVVPAAVLFPGDDSVTIGNGNRTTVLTVAIRLYMLPIPRMEDKYRDLYTWRSWLRTAFDGAVTISGNAVQVAVTATTLGTDTYADQDYLTVEATAEVTVYDTVAFTA